MALISKKFLDTVQGNNNDIAPIVLLGDLNEETKEYDILDLFSTRAVEVHVNNYSFDRKNAIQAKPILKNISSIKNSVDVENRKLKTNTFRFSIYNYYDPIKSLSSSDDYVQTEEENPIASLVGKHIVLYYKSQSTTEIDISQNTTYFNDNYSCPILFRGVVTRAKISNDIITLQGEDFTQDFLKDNSVPSTKISDLEETIRNNVIIEDKETPIPMVFGKVDKSPAIAFNTNYSNNEGFKSLGFLHDIYPTTGKYTTSKLLNDFDAPTYMYVKDGDDYLVFQYETYYYEYLGRTYFLESSTSQTAVVPELSSSQSQSIYCLGYTYATNAISDLSAGDTSSLSGTISEDESINPDYSPLLANYGMKRGWYRQGEIQNLISDEDSFDFGHKSYPTSTEKGTGRWILVQLDKKEILQGFRCYSRLYVDPNDPDVVMDPDGSEENPENRTRLYFKPFNPDQWKTIMESSLSQGNWIFTIYDDDPLPASYIADSSQDATFPKVEDTAQNLDYWESQDIRDNLGFFDDPDGNQSYSYDLIGPNGLTQSKVRVDYDGSTPCDRVIIWESYKAPSTPTKTIQCGGYMHSFSAKYLKKIEDYTSSEFYASIIGRKDYASTEPIGSTQEQAEQISGTWSDALLGADGIEPDYEAVLNFWDDYFEKNYIIAGSDRFFEEHGGSFEEAYDDYFTVPKLLDKTWLEPYVMGLANYWELFTDIGISKKVSYDDTGTFEYESIEFPDLEALGLDDSTLMKSNQVVSLALHGIMKKYHHAAWLHHGLEYAYYGAVEDGIVGFEESQGANYSTMVIAQMLPQTHFGFYKFLFYMRQRSNNHLKYALNRMQERFEVWSVFRRALIRRTLQYVYQNEISDEPELDTIFQDTATASWYGNLFGETWGGSQPFAYEWNSPELNLVDDNGEIIPEGWLEHFELYMNDTVETALYSDGNAFFGQMYEYIYYNAVNSQYNELHSWNDDPALVGEGYSEIANQYTNPSIVELYKYISVDSLDIECFSGGVEGGVGYVTNGVVNKPIDIIINILSKELKYGLNENGSPSKEYYNEDLISKSREFYSGWEMGFCISEKIDADKLISDLCKETQSFFTFKPDGSFDLITIKNKYIYDDIEHTIQEEEIFNYSFDKTKREHIITSCNYFYRYDNGQNTYPKETGILKASDLIYGGQYDGDNYYNLSEGVGFKEKNLRFHSEAQTAKTFQQFDLLNNCNQHIIAKLELPLKYVNIEVGSIIHIPLIKNEKVFGVDYSKISYINGQAIYPAWIVTEVDIKLDKVVIKAYQLHYLGVDGDHGFLFEGETIELEKNLNEFHSEYRHGYSDNPEGEPLPNWNYFNVETQGQEGFSYVHNDELQIPYCDVDGSGVINVVDIVSTVTMILEGTDAFSVAEIERADFGGSSGDGVINVVDIVKIVDVILGPTDV